MTTLARSSLSDIRDFITSLDQHEIKPCISLVRHGFIPSLADRSLVATIPETLLAKLFDRFDSEVIPTEIGLVFFRVAIDPLISSSIISFCLARIPSQVEIDTAFLNSLSKEVIVMEGTKRPATIAWRQFFEPTHHDCFILPHQEHDSTGFAVTVNASFRRFRDLIEYSRIWPHGTNRGISRSAQDSLRFLRSVDDTAWMTMEDWTSQISSLMVIKHYLHTGSWASGNCEIKQKWYPSGLTPRTYFAQGGDAIQASCYLRNFFNEFTDTYVPTERIARVDGSRLICPDGGYFFIYDLTSFTSNFHEQLSFLQSMADFFRETIVYTVGKDLLLQEQTIGDMIDTYCNTVNDLPKYEFQRDILDFALDSITFVHHVAGFLGVPGNLVTCTLAHGVSIGVTIRDVRMQSCAGDDGNIGVPGEKEEMDARKTIHLLGTFNDSKASTTRENGRGSYLKRSFKQVENKGFLFNRVDFPLLGAVNVMEKDDPRFPGLSKDRKRLRQSIAASTAKLFRDLFLSSQGNLTDDVIEYILSYLRLVYGKAGLPTSGMVRGLYGSDIDREGFAIKAAVVFPLSERYLKRDPDLVLTEDFLPWVLDIPVQTDTQIVFKEGERWEQGSDRLGRSNPALEKLVKFGYVERAETERITVIGEEARRHFRRLLREDFEKQEYRYTAMLPLTSQQLSSIGLVESSDYFWRRLFFESYQPYQLSKRVKYQDLDHVTDIFSESSLGLEDLY